MFLEDIESQYDLGANDDLFLCRQPSQTSVGKEQDTHVSILNQKLIILSLTQNHYDSRYHGLMLKTVRNHLAMHLSEDIIKVLSINCQKWTAEASEIFEKDIFEAIGFQNGYRPWSDIRERLGSLGLTMVIHFLERISKLYKNASISKKVENTYFWNMVNICQNSSISKFDGFPLILVFLNVISKALELIEL